MEGGSGGLPPGGGYSGGFPAYGSPLPGMPEAMYHAQQQAAYWHSFPPLIGNAQSGFPPVSYSPSGAGALPLHFASGAAAYSSYPAAVGLQSEGTQAASFQASAQQPSAYESASAASPCPPALASAAAGDVPARGSAAASSEKLSEAPYTSSVSSGSSSSPGASVSSPPRQTTPSSRPVSSSTASSVVNHPPVSATGALQTACGAAESFSPAAGAPSASSLLPEKACSSSSSPAASSLLSNAPPATAACLHRPHASTETDVSASPRRGREPSADLGGASPAVSACGLKGQAEPDSAPTADAGKEKAAGGRRRVRVPQLRFRKKAANNAAYLKTFSKVFGKRGEPVVWCKRRGRPWWPGLLANPDDPHLVPPLPDRVKAKQVLSGKEELRLLFLCCGTWRYWWASPKGLLDFRESYADLAPRVRRLGFLPRLAIQHALEECGWRENGDWCPSRVIVAAAQASEEADPDNADEEEGWLTENPCSSDSEEEDDGFMDEDGWWEGRKIDSSAETSTTLAEREHQTSVDAAASSPPAGGCQASTQSVAICQGEAGRRSSSVPLLPAAHALASGGRGKASPEAEVGLSQGASCLTRGREAVGKQEARLETGAETVKGSAATTPQEGGSSAVAPADPPTPCRSVRLAATRGLHMPPGLPPVAEAAAGRPEGASSSSAARPGGRATSGASPGAFSAGSAHLLHPPFAPADDEAEAGDSERKLSSMCLENPDPEVDAPSQLTVSAGEPASRREAPEGLATRDHACAGQAPSPGGVPGAPAMPGSGVAGTPLFSSPAAADGAAVSASSARRDGKREKSPVAHAAGGIASAEGDTAQAPARDSPPFPEAVAPAAEAGGRGAPDSGAAVQTTAKAGTVDGFSLSFAAPSEAAQMRQASLARAAGAGPESSSWPETIWQRLRQQAEAAAKKERAAPAPPSLEAPAGSPAVVSPATEKPPALFQGAQEATASGAIPSYGAMIDAFAHDKLLNKREDQVLQPPHIRAAAAAGAAAAAMAAAAAASAAAEKTQQREAALRLQQAAQAQGVTEAPAPERSPAQLAKKAAEAVASVLEGQTEKKLGGAETHASAVDEKEASRARKRSGTTAARRDRRRASAEEADTSGQGRSTSSGRRPRASSSSGERERSRRRQGGGETSSRRRSRSASSSSRSRSPRRKRSRPRLPAAGGGGASGGSHRLRGSKRLRGRDREASSGSQSPSVSARSSASRWSGSRSVDSCRGHAGRHRSPQSGSSFSSDGWQRRRGKLAGRRRGLDASRPRDNAHVGTRRGRGSWGSPEAYRRGFLDRHCGPGGDRTRGSSSESPSGRDRRREEDRRERRSSWRNDARRRRRWTPSNRATALHSASASPAPSEDAEEPRRWRGKARGEDSGDASCDSGRRRRRRRGTRRRGRSSSGSRDERGRRAGSSERSPASPSPPASPRKGKDGGEAERNEEGMQTPCTSANPMQEAAPLVNATTALSASLSGSAFPACAPLTIAEGAACGPLAQMPTASGSFASSALRNGNVHAFQPVRSLSSSAASRQPSDTSARAPHLSAGPEVLTSPPCGFFGQGGKPGCEAVPAPKQTGLAEGEGNAVESAPVACACAPSTPSSAPPPVSAVPAPPSHLLASSLAALGTAEAMASPPEGQRDATNAEEDRRASRASCERDGAAGKRRRRSSHDSRSLSGTAKSRSGSRGRRHSSASSASSSREGSRKRRRGGAGGSTERHRSRRPRRSRSPLSSPHPWRRRRSARRRLTSSESLRSDRSSRSRGRRSSSGDSRSPAHGRRGRERRRHPRSASRGARRRFSSDEAGSRGSSRPSLPGPTRPRMHPDGAYLSFAARRVRVLHAKGRCVPCRFHWRRQGCRNGDGCKFCHDPAHDAFMLARDGERGASSRSSSPLPRRGPEKEYDGGRGRLEPYAASSDLNGDSSESRRAAEDADGFGGVRGRGERLFRRRSPSFATPQFISGRGDRGDRGGGWYVDNRRPLGRIGDSLDREFGRYGSRSARDRFGDRGGSRTARRWAGEEDAESGDARRERWIEGEESSAEEEDGASAGQKDEAVAGRTAMSAGSSAAQSEGCGQVPHGAALSSAAHAAETEQTLNEEQEQTPAGMADCWAQGVAVEKERNALPAQQAAEPQGSTDRNAQNSGVEQLLA
ncbi:hypothetical protein BESB_060670 [Besnoitia besnoiti]|uniref:PWWP domain-containing protein n=1 Tax=Besnoitia besnoiti TaxID=94643 RepID=A0A2A9MIF5_BESBE|nr:hypothetical protein BESB_060670 [Besnoitia besnoiti]PFH35180.1 hypothetical protein BESB_060670 [Besnoitia besnoiti]